jgi:lysophospholipase L1-like esterase
VLTPRKRFGPAAAARPNNPTAPPEPLGIAAFGDSLMWGQGLKRNETFAELIASSLGKLHKKRASVVINRSRSGAQIMPRVRARDETDQREQFLDRYPALFSSKPQRARFQSGEDEGPATKLYGEIPASFPTIRWQIKAVDDALGKKIDVVLLSGGANDINFEDVISPMEFPGEFIEQFDGLIRAIAHDDVLDLIQRARSKCPKAIIMVFGYWAPISYSSHKSGISDFFKHELNSDFLWTLNRVSKNALKNVPRLILEARIRSVWAQGRAQHWIRQAVTHANQSAVLRAPLH